MIKMLFKNETGLVLLEISITLALISIVMGSLLAVYYLAGSSFEKITIEAEMQFALRDAARIMKQDIYGSEKAQILESAEGKEAGYGEQGSALRLLTGQKNGLVIDCISIGYYVENRTLYRHRYNLHDLENPWDDQFLDKIPIADNMSYLMVSNPISSLIEYQLGTKKDGFECIWSGSCKSKVPYGLNRI